MRLRLSPRVPEDLKEIADFIARDSPKQALRVLRLLTGKMREIAKRPELYRLRPEIGVDARLAVVGQYVILSNSRHEWSQNRKSCVGRA